MMTTNEKGSLAEIAIAWAAMKAGAVVLRPLIDGRRYDLVFDLGPSLVRVQCKWAPRMGEVVRLNTRTSYLSTRGHVRTSYRKHEVDAVAGYCPELERCFLLPIEEIDGQTMVHLRLTPARNNQQAGIKAAEDYDLANMISRLGAIAQLGERLHGMQEVAGSSPASSTPEAA